MSQLTKPLPWTTTQELLTAIAMEDEEWSLWKPRDGFQGARSAPSASTPTDDRDLREGCDVPLLDATRSQRFRTLAGVSLEVAVGGPATLIYQLIAVQAAAMHARGARVSAISRHLRVDHHTVDKALRWLRQC